ncbi:hypothetical protein BH09ACT10_BH09ACT10_26300 [soil metagenome]
MDPYSPTALAARQEIYDVMLRYCRGIDRLDEALVRSCYHEGAIDNHGLYNGSVDLFISNAFPRQRKLLVAQHMVQNFTVEFAGDAAVVETYALATERRRNDDDSMTDTVVGLRYVDRFELRGGAWLIVRRTVVIEWTRDHQVDEGWLQGAEFTRGKRDTTDKIYEELALLHAGE